MLGLTSMWVDEWPWASTGSTQTASTNTIARLYNQASTTNSITTVPIYWSNWVNEHDQNYQRLRNEQVSTQIQLMQMRVEWEVMYGRHMAETVERQRARAALDRHSQAHETIVREQPEARAERLLLEHLTANQRAQYERSKWFIVDGKSGRRYRIRAGFAANVDALRPDGSVDHRLCAVLSGVPLADHLLAQKLHLELAEADFLRVAIRHPASNQANYQAAA